MDKIIMPVFNSYRDNPNIPMPKEHYDFTLINTNHINQILQNQAHHEENIRSHVTAIKSMSNELSKLSKIMILLERKLNKD